VSLRFRLRRVEKSAHVDMIVVSQPDGSIKRFHPEALMDALVSNWERGVAYRAGEEPLPEPHPLLDALYNAPEEVVEELCDIPGTGMVGFIASEEVLFFFRGDVERPGPEVTWNSEGTVCE
jgi:hypothetical protein